MPLTPTEALLDVNVLIAAVFSDHVMHTTAREFVEGLTRFYTTPMTQGGFLRFATRPWKLDRSEEQPPRLKMAEAQATLRQFIQAEGHSFLPDASSFTDLDSRSLQGHRQWTDAYLLHTARMHGVSLASLDTRISNLDDPTNASLFLVD